MAWETAIDAVTKNSIINNQQTTVPRPTVNPVVAANLSNIKQRAGWVPVETQLALAKANASNQAIDLIGQMAAKKAVDMQAEPVEPDQSNLVYKNIKTVSRWLTATLDFIPELAQGAASQALEIAGEYGIGSYGQGTERINNVDGWFASTRLGSLIKATQGDINPATGLPVNVGTGWFVSDEVLERAGERARKYRGTINGQAFTVGRAAASTIFKPKTLPYNIFSGVIDALLLVKTDPIGPIAKAVKEYKDVTTLVPRLTKKQTAELSEIFRSEAGMIPGLSDVGLNETKYANFMNNNLRAQTLVARLRKESDPVKIMDIFDQSPNISNDLIGLLARAETDDQVKAVLALGFSLERGSLTDQIRLLQKTGFVLNKPLPILGRSLKNIGGSFVERTHLANSKFVRKIDGVVTKYLTEQPEKAMIVHGDRFQNSVAAKNIINYLRTVGASEETVSRIGRQAIEAFTETGTRPEQKKVLDVFEEAMREVLTQKKVNKQVQDELFNNAKNGVDELRSYMNDRAGNPTDNGLAKVLANEFLEFFPNDEIEKIIKVFGENSDYRIVDPLQISEFLKRVVVLPDPREIRRLTSNRFFGLTEKLGSVAGRTGIRQVHRVVKGKEDEYDKLGEDISYLLQMKNAGHGIPDDIDEALDMLRMQRQGLEESVDVRVRTGKERAAWSAIDLLQNQIWKPLTLMTGGYIVRNSIDAQVRMAFSGLPSVFTHPIEYIQLVLGTSKRVTLKGDVLTGIKYKNLGQQTADVRDALSFGLRQAGASDKDVYTHMVKTNNWNIVSREMVNGRKLHTDAVAQNGVISFNDLLKKIAAQTFVEYGGVSDEAVKVATKRIVAAIKADKDLLNTVQQRFKFGFDIVESGGRSGKLPPMRINEMPENELENLLYRYAKLAPVADAQMLTGNLPEIEFAYAFNRLLLHDADGNIVAKIYRQVDELKAFGPQKPLQRGSTVLTSTDPDAPSFGVITAIVDPDTGRRLGTEIAIEPHFSAEIQPIELQKTKDVTVPMTAFGDNGLGTKKFRSRVQKSPTSDDPNWVTGSSKGLPSKLKREQLASERNTETWRKTQDKATNWFFGQLYGFVTRKLDRSPVFRKYYYEEVGKYVDELSPEGAKDALKAIKEAADEAGVSVEKYVGDEKLLKNLKKALDGNGTASLEELDDYAKYASLNKTRELLYDASNRSNLEDAMRIVAPFAPAWREIVGTYAHIFREDPLRLYRNTTRVYNGAATADPDNDGRGFFFRDPVTDVVSFMFPASGTLAKAATGLDAPLKAPLQRLSQGLQIFPAIGPFVQFVASKFIPDTPKTDKIVEILLPYGRKGGTETTTAFFPGYARKLLQALTRDEGKMDTVYANTYVETLRALSATGKYDLGNPDEIKLLQSDAKGKAQWLTAFRALSQFLGPTAGATEFKITTKDGDIFVGELIKQFYALQTKDYDSAVQTFLDQFGDETSLYVSSKSRSLVQGLEATEQFGDWERSNENLMKEYPDIAAYLAPGGDDFSFAVWERQIRTGKRERLTDKEIIDLAQERIGSAKYRWAKKQIGQFPNENQRILLKRYREALHAELPGFPLVSEFTVGEFDNNILDMGKLVYDQRVADNEIAKSIKTYLQFRAAAKQVAFQRFGSDNIGKQSKRTQYLRDKLASIGEMLIMENPEFGRVWQRFLAREVED